MELFRPPNISVARMMAEIGELLVEPDTAARVVIDARTGTVVIGQDVQISTVAVTHGTLNVRISETPEVSQPNPLSDGKDNDRPANPDRINQAGGQIAVVNGSSLRSLVTGLNRLGVKPRHHRDLAGDKVRGRAAGRPRRPIAVRPTQARTGSFELMYRFPDSPPP